MLRLFTRAPKPQPSRIAVLTAFVSSLWSLRHVSYAIDRIIAFTGACKLQWRLTEALCTRV